METPKSKTLPDKEKSKPAANADTGDDALATAFQDTPEMIDYLDFLDTLNDALERGEGEAMLPTASLSRIRDGLQPLDFAHLRQAWNRVCDELGKPGQKLPEPPPPPEPRGREGSTF